jgi:hypothetical protein
MPGSRTAGRLEIRVENPDRGLADNPGFEAVRTTRCAASQSMVLCARRSTSSK